MGGPLASPTGRVRLGPALHRLAGSVRRDFVGMARPFIMKLSQELRETVTSPGGTTAAALEVLMAENGMQPLFDKAIKAVGGEGVPDVIHASLMPWL